MTPRFGPLAIALALAAMTVGLPIPGLRLLVVDSFGHGGLGAGAFAGLHVAGTIAGAWLWGRLFRRRSGEVGLRSLSRFAFVASAVLLLATGIAHSFALLLALRFADGIAHVGIVMLLMGAGAHGSEQDRARRMGWLGAILVLGVGTGLALGGTLATVSPRAPFFTAALLACIGALLTVRTFPAQLETSAESSAMSPAEGPVLGFAVIGPMALICVERLAMGVLTVALPYAASGSGARTVGAVLGIFMTASVFTMPMVRRVHTRFGSSTGCHVAALALSLLLLALLWTPTLTMPLAVIWALFTGAAAGAVFMGGLLAIASRADSQVRMRALGIVHAAGGVGHMLGAFGAGAMVAWQAPAPGALGAFAPAAVAAMIGGVSVAIGWLVFALSSRRSLADPVPILDR
ncbi:MAG: MFS transporter [Acidobacteriota bacterium]